MKPLFLTIIFCLAGSAMAGARLEPDPIGGYYIEDEVGYITGRLVADGIGGWYVEDNVGYITGHWVPDPIGGFEFQPN